MQYLHRPLDVSRSLTPPSVNVEAENWSARLDVDQSVIQWRLNIVVRFHSCAIGLNPCFDRPVCCL